MTTSKTGGEKNISPFLKGIFVNGGDTDALLLKLKNLKNADSY